MTPENQALLEAFRGMMTEAITPLATRMGGLETRMEGLETRMEGLETRMEGLETRMEGLETHVETIDARTSQMSNDLLDLRDRVPLLEERVDNGFRALKSDLNFAFSDSRKAAVGHDRSEKAIEGLRREIASIQQRLAALENAKSGS
jgi:chromosome segregation ATPase